MTSPLANIVAQPTKCRFWPKKLNQLNIFVICLAYSWSWVKKLDNIIFCNSLYSKTGPYNCRIMIKWTQFQSQKYFLRGQFVRQKSIFIWVYNFVHKKWGHTKGQLQGRGQLTSKCLLGVFNSPKKRTKTIRLEVP